MPSWMTPEQLELKRNRDNYAVDQYQLMVLTETEEDLQRIIERLADSNACPPLHESFLSTLEAVKSIKGHIQRNIQEDIAQLKSDG